MGTARSLRAGCLLLIAAACLICVVSAVPSARYHPRASWGTDPWSEDSKHADSSDDDAGPPEPHYIKYAREKREQELRLEVEQRLKEAQELLSKQQNQTAKTEEPKKAAEEDSDAEDADYRGKHKEGSEEHHYDHRGHDSEDDEHYHPHHHHGHEQHYHKEKEYHQVRACL